MSEKTDRRIKKGLNALRQARKDMARDLIEELDNAPLKYRLRFALKLVFHRRKKS